MPPQPTEPNAFHQSIRLLFTRRFGTYWFATLLANIGTWAQQVAQPWLLLSLGASPFVLGLDTFALGAPVLVLTLVGGMLADRANRRSIITWCQSIQMLCPTLLVALLWTDAVRPWMVIALSLVVGITDALSMPSFQTIVSSLVDKRQLPTGIALNTTQFNLSRIIGPAVAGVLMASVGAMGAFAVSAASYVPFILVAMWALPRTMASSAEDPPPGVEPLLASVRTVTRQPALRGALLTVLTTATLCAPLITFVPILVRDVFQQDAGHFSLAVSAFGVGGLLGGLVLLTRNPDHDPRPISAGAALAYALVVVLCALNPWSWGLPVLLCAGGLFMTAGNASANAFLQTAAPGRLRGQTISLFMLAMRGGVSLGGLLTGALVNLVGIRQALLLNGVLALAAHLSLRRAWMRSARPS